eukprot:213452_1
MKKAPNFGICFDVDGVLVRGGKVFDSHGNCLGYKPVPIPGIQQTLERIRSARVPFVLMTNDSGSVPDTKIKKLNSIFPGLELVDSQLIQPSRPIRALPSVINPKKRKLVVACSAERANALARAFGWINCISLQEYARARPELMPIQKYDTPTEAEIDAAKISIDIVVILLRRPANWHEALQVLTDILRSDGVPGIDNESEKQTVEVLVGNPDAQFSGAYEVPRLTTGTFVTCLDATLKSCLGRPLNYTWVGKPSPLMNQCAEQELERLATELSESDNQSTVPNEHCSATNERKTQTDRIERIYMIGDNPRSDIRGANLRGGRWVSVLVRSGMFKGENDSINPAKYVFDDAAKAIESIFEM